MAADGITQARSIVDVRGLRKRFGQRDVLSHLDWRIPGGRVIGLLGKNGAGKTTLLRCMAGLSPIDEGSIEILGHPIDQPGGERLQHIGFVPQTFDLFPWMKVRGYLDFTAAFYPRWNHAQTERLLDGWQIDRKQKVGQLSQGQRQKLAIIRALAPDPDLLLLDEPVASLILIPATHAIAIPFVGMVTWLAGMLLGMTLRTLMRTDTLLLPDFVRILGQVGMLNLVLWLMHRFGVLTGGLAGIVICLPFGLGAWQYARREYLTRRPCFDAPLD
ncbi:MAG TPA: ABC transporter ATP-binding protein [Rhodanobacteraceae bacterium]|nr:ABC transporter ATP-binding protein [Rhodanobacteraceae bacterium]